MNVIVPAPGAVLVMSVKVGKKIFILKWIGKAVMSLLLQIY
jgi:hypothetical protein